MTVPLVVMAAGLSRRFGGLKQLHPVGPGGEAVLDYNVYDAARAGFSRILYVVRPAILEAVRAHVSQVIGDQIPAEFVCQELDQLPEGFRAPPDRKKPWGTGQAVLEAARHIDGPFAVCNADDLYGPGAFELLYRHMASDPAPTESALIGYRLSDTLSGSGEVARGVCVLRREGTLEGLIEVRQVRRRDGWVTGIEVDGEPVELTGNETVSMNLWGFRPDVVERLQRQFERFLEYWGSDTQHEFFLSISISDQIKLGHTEVRVYPSPDPWVGMTQLNDDERLRRTLAERISAGVYPERLAEGFAELV
ncbi:MAG: NTP transferase domain-containing protein [Gemmatimonadota bacterium]